MNAKVFDLLIPAFLLGMFLCEGSRIAASLEGTVKDPNWALIAQAAIRR